MKRLLKLVPQVSFMIYLIVFCFMQSEVRAETQLTFSIVSPQVNSLQYDNLEFIISKPSSTYQITEVKAKVEDRETILTYTDHAYSDRGFKYPGWVGNLNLNGLSRGDKTLEVTVKDFNGNSITNKIIFKYSQKPTLIVNSPKNFDFTKGYIDLDAEASDLAGEKCIIEAYISTETYGGEKLFESVGRIKEQINLNKYNGQSRYIRFDVSNETGGTNSILKKISIDNSSFLDIRNKVDGEILDLNKNKVLYKTVYNELKIKDLETSSEQLVFSHNKNLVGYAFLTAQGALFTVQNVEPYYKSDSLFEYKGGILIFQGRLSYYNFLKVNGDYAIWSGDLNPIDTIEEPSGNELYLKDLVTNNITQISNEARYNNHDVTSRGEVVFQSGTGHNIYKYYNGSIYKLSSDSEYYKSRPLTDGNITIYKRHEGDKYHLVLNANGEEQLIATSSEYGFSANSDYRINNGYAAYTNYVNGIKQVFIWKDGISKQLTYWGSDSYIDSLNEQGDVIVRKNNGSYLIKFNGNQPIKLYNINLNNYWIDQKLFGINGCSVLEIETDIIPATGVTISNTEFKLVKGQEIILSASILPSNATSKSVSWLSSNTSVASVDYSGKVTAVGLGSAVITVMTEDVNKTAMCNITVTNPVITVTSVSLNKTQDTLTIGDTETLIATVNPVNANNKSVTWSSSNTSVATVDYTGRITALGSGNTVITVSTEEGKMTATCNITVNKPSDIVKQKVVKTKNITLGVKESYSLKLKSVKYTTSKATIAAVKSGVIKTYKTGKVTIKAIDTSGNVRVYNITVKKAPTRIVKLNVKTKSLKKGKKLIIKATLPTNTASNKITYLSKNKKVATVSESGVVKAKKKGKAEIIVKTFNGKSKTCIIIVK